MFSSLRGNLERKSKMDWKGEIRWEKGKREVKIKVPNVAFLPKRIGKCRPSLGELIFLLVENHFPPITTKQRKMGTPLIQENVST